MKKSTSSFTLIELLVVVSIVTFFSGLAFASFKNFGQKKNVEKESQKIVDVLSLAKTKTATGDASQCSGTPSSVDYYFVHYFNSTNYQLIPSCLVGTPVINTYSLSSNVTISSFSDIKFAKLNGPVTAVCFKVTKGNDCRYVQVTSQGIINEGFTVCDGSCP